MFSPRIRKAVATAGTGILVLLAACGGGGNSIEAIATEFAFAPTTWTIASGEEVTLELVNNGTVEHNWSLVKRGSEISSEGDLPEDPAARAGLYEVKVTAAAAETTSVTFTAPAPGEYQIICDIQAHFSAGMKGSLTVEG
jgi:plastocyanin